MNKNFDYTPIIRFYRYIYTINKDTIKIKDLFWDIFKSNWDLKINHNSEVLFFQSMDRNDYNNFSKLILSTLPKKNTQHIFIQKKKINNFKAFLHNIPKYFNLYKAVKTIEDKKERLYIFFIIIDLLKLKYHIKLHRPKIVIVHADMQPSENLIVQHFNNMNIPTITLQHGIYIDYAKAPNINESNYLNISSKYFLAWGQDTRNLIQNYHPNCNVNILGNPTLIEKPVNIESFFVLIFEHEGNKKFNHVLLKIGKEISKKLNLSLKVKLHPNNIFKEYNITRDEVIKHDKVYNAKFAIGHTSSMLYQLLRNNIPIFKLKSDSPCNYTNKNLVFANTEELLSKIHILDKINILEEGKYYIKYTEEESLNKYRDFFNKLLLKA